MSIQCEFENHTINLMKLQHAVGKQDKKASGPNTGFSGCYEEMTE